MPIDHCAFLSSRQYAVALSDMEFRSIAQMNDDLINMCLIPQVDIIPSYTLVITETELDDVASRLVAGVDMEADEAADAAGEAFTPTFLREDVAYKLREQRLLRIASQRLGSIQNAWQWYHGAQLPEFDQRTPHWIARIDKQPEKIEAILRTSSPDLAATER